MSLPTPKEFYEKYNNDPEAAKRAAFQIGKEMGQALRQKYNRKGEGLESVAELLNDFMRTVMGKPSARVEGNKVIMRNAGFCAVMRAALTLNMPWEWLDTNYAWPSLHGMASTIIPDIKMKIPSARCRGDSACIHIFEIE